MTHPAECMSPDQRATSRHRALLVVFLVSTALWLTVDQLGKWWAFASWRDPDEIKLVIPGLLAGARARNYAGMFSLEGVCNPCFRHALTIAGFLALCMVLRWALVLDRDRWCGFDAAAGGLLFAGALGNQVDRLSLGYVRDYLLLAFRPGEIFNTADLFMILGGVLLLVSLRVRHRTRLPRA